jgi:predicted MPP superfamily phosphohydrolase
MKEVRVPRYDQSQVDGTLVHPKLPQPRTTTGGDDDDIIQNQNNSKNININNRFVICADTQYGMITDNEEWEIELEYSRKAITYINRMNPFPAFCCVCGDLTDKVQKQQRHDFKMIWSELNDDIALVCVCGNHDVGNRPTKHAIELYRNEFGDDHLAFWSSSNVYNIVVNTTLFSDPSYDESTEEMYRNQLQWLEGRLKYVRSLQPSSSSSSQPSTTILVFGHHPWYLYDEEEDVDTMTGSCEWKSNTIPDSYFIIPKHRRKVVFELFRKYNVSASFSGHFHQNLVTETSFGMKMIITGPLSATLESSGKKNTKNNNNDKDGIVTEPNTLGLRVVEVLDDGSIKHEFVTLSSI